MKLGRFSAILVVSIVLVSALTAPLRRAYSFQSPEREAPTSPKAMPGIASHWFESSSEITTGLEPSLLRQVLSGDRSGQYRVIIELDFEPLSLPVSPDSAKADLRNQAVAHMQSEATGAQAELLGFLEAQQRAGHVQSIRPFWIVNGIAATADAETLLDLAARPDVRLIREDRWRQWAEPPTITESASPSINPALEWNLAQIGADLAWSALGLDGSGVTVGIIDTGVDWQHPALQARYRGYKPGGLPVHAGNWFCTTDEGALYPVDGHGHGTHVAGTAVGSQDIAGLGIGVAPGARWIAVKTLNDQGYAYDSWIHAAFEWLMAPGGDPGLAPDIINGSWGTYNAQDETFRPDLQALRAAGIVPVFAAGNEGPRASSLRSPASYPEAIAVGATDDRDEVTSFSSRGPSPWGEVKPEVAAPGAQIRSSLPGGAYGTASGTSMAAPHVTGVVALMLQADPTLSVDEVEDILTSTALPLGSQVPNNSSGWGRIDAYRAASSAMNAGTVVGRVTRQPDLQPLPHAQIRVTTDLGEPWASVQADEMGEYNVALPAGRYGLVFEAFGYVAQIVTSVTVQAGATTTVDVSLSPAPSGVLWGQITHAETGGPVAVEVSIPGTPARTHSDPQTGQYSLALPAGTYAVHMARNGYRRHIVNDIEIVADEDTRLDAALAPAPTLLLVDSGPWYYGSQWEYFAQALDDRDYVYNLWQIRDLPAGLPSLADLQEFDVTIWSAPQDSPGLIGAGDVISSYLSIGGNLLLTGQDVGFWDDGLSGLYWHPYYEHWLKAKAISDDAGRDDLVGAPDEIFDGLVLPLNGPDGAANQISPDAIAVRDPRVASLIGHYEGHEGAALQASGCQSYRTVYLAAGLEGLGDRASRAEVMDRALTWLSTPHAEVEVRLDPPDQDQVWLEGLSITYTVELQNRGASTDRFALELSPSVWPASLSDGSFTEAMTQSMALNPCHTQTLGLEVTIPQGVAWNLRDTVTLTARSLTDSDHTTQASFSSKAPAPILLVDDHRWFDTSDAYGRALDAVGLPYDVWQRNPPLFPDKDSPSLERLQRYPVTIWFTAYDWFKTLTPSEEARLATYLEAGGRLLLSSQDYLYTSGFTDFARDYFGVVGFTEGLTATQVTEAVSSPIGQGQGPYELVYPFRNWSDALEASPGTDVVLWGQHGQPVALAKRQALWKTAFFAFPLEALDSQDMITVLGDTVEWLSPLGDSSFVTDARAVSPGDELIYNLRIHNSGPRLLSGVSLSNTLPLSTTYVAGSMMGPAEYDPATRSITWSGALAADETATVTYRLQLDSSLPDGASISNAAHLSDESALVVDRVTTTRINTPDLAGSLKAVSAQVGVPGEVLTYTLTLRNDGLRPAQAHLIDPIPPNAAYQPGLGWASSGQLTSTAQVVTWAGSIPEDQVVTLTFPAVISPSVGGKYVYNRAILQDGWGNTHPLEAFTWVEARLFLPLIFKHP